eukprot:symbB.v1.2.027799.t1/scaffold2881.1/size68116/4
MERAVLDWQGLSFAGFTDGAHVQRTVADWLQLGGGVERKVEQPEPANPPDSAAKSEYSDYTYYTEVKVGEERGHPRRTCFSRPSVEEPHTASSSKWKKNFSPPSVSRSRSPLPRRGWLICWIPIVQTPVVKTAVEGLSENTNFVPLDKIKGDAKVRSYFRRVLFKPPWENPVWVTYFQSRPTAWEFDERTMGVKIKSELSTQIEATARQKRKTAAFPEALYGAVLRAGTPVETSTVVANAKDSEIAALPIDAIEALLGSLGNKPEEPAAMPKHMDACVKVMAAVPGSLEKKGAALSDIMRFFDMVLKFHPESTDPRLTTQRILTLKELCEASAIQIRSKGVGNTGTKALGLLCSTAPFHIMALVKRVKVMMLRLVPISSREFLLPFLKRYPQSRGLILKLTGMRQLLKLSEACAKSKAVAETILATVSKACSAALPSWSMDEVSKLLFTLAKVKVTDSAEMAELYSRAAEVASTNLSSLRNDFFKASKHICYAFSNEPLDMAVNGTKERLTKEAVRRELAAEAARAQIAKAQEAKEALVTQARANAACAISAVQERKKRDEERHLMELALAKETLEEAQKQSNARIEAAEGSLSRAGEEGRLRVQAAEQRNQDAIEMAKGVAVESKALSQARVEDAKRRTAEIEALVQLQVTEAEKRQASQLREAEDRAAHVEKEAQLRAEDTKQAAAVILEKQVAELQLWLSQAEDEMLRTQDRLEIEQAKAQKLIGNVHAMAENFQQRGELCRQRAEEMVVETGEEVAKMIEEYRQWRVEEMEYVACQADGLQGLDDFVRRLREKPMLEDTALGSA